MSDRLPKNLRRREAVERAHRPYWHTKLAADFCEACGDDWPCLPWRQTQPPKCLCSHLRHDGQCYSAACGCQTYRPENAT